MSGIPVRRKREDSQEQASKRLHLSDNNDEEVFAATMASQGLFEAEPMDVDERHDDAGDEDDVQKSTKTEDMVVDENSEDEIRTDSLDLNSSISLTQPHTIPDYYPKDNEHLTGSVTKIIMKNFMCHENLVVEFRPRITFICGRNGSGKSAVLTALVLVLGGSAKNTERGNSMKGFVRNGCRQAVLQVFLHNVGPEAYNHEQYGDVIQISRTISAQTGVSSWRIKGEHQKLISMKKEEISRICNRFNFQVNNPVCIMTQDTSRTFFKNKNAGDMYKLFWKATQLDQVKAAYAEADRKFNEFCARLEPKKENIKNLALTRNTLHKQLEAFESMNTITDEVHQARRRLKWKLFQTAEDRAVECIEELDNSKKGVTSHEEVFKLIPERLKKFHNDKEKATHNVNLLQPEFNSKQSELEVAESEMRQADANVNRIKRDVIRTQNTVNEATKTLKKLEATLAEIQNDNGMAIYLKKRDEIMGKISEAQNKIAGCDNNIKELEDKFPDAHARVATASEGFRTLNDKINPLKREIDDLRSEIQRLQGSKNDALMPYHQKIRLLVQTIEKNSAMFSKKPIGPLGQYIKVANAKFTFVIERAIGHHLLSFLVDNHGDERKLRSLMDKLGINQQPTIVTMRFASKAYQFNDRPHLQGSSFYSSLIDLITIDAPEQVKAHITNVLLDHAGASRVVIMESKTEAADACMSKLFDRNLTVVFDNEGSQHYQWPNYKYYSGPKSHERSVKYLSKDVTELARSYKIKLDECVSRMQRYAVESKKMKDEKEEAQKAYIEVESKIRNLKAIRNKCREDIPRLNRDLPDEPESTDARISAAQDEIIEAKQEEERAKKELGELGKSLEDAEKLVDEKEQALDGVKKSFSEVQAKHEEAKLAEDKLERKISKLEMTKMTLSQELAVLKEKYEKKQREVAQQEQYIENAKQKIIDKGFDAIDERIEESSESLERKCMRLKAKQEEIEAKLRQRNGLSRAEIVQKLGKTQKKFEEAESDYHYCQGIYRTLMRIMHQRQEEFDYVLYRSTWGLRRTFERGLRSRDFEGKVTVDHANQTIEVDVIPPHRKVEKPVGDADKTGDKTSNQVKALSGGEKSFSMVCLMVSLWESADMPLRMLDEFDVFMDNVNRTFALELLLRGARQFKRQFVFLTPLSIELAQVKKEEVFRMGDPERA